VAPPLLAVRHGQEYLFHRQMLCGTGHQAIRPKSIYQTHSKQLIRFFS
jgi:hypothetical protein